METAIKLNSPDIFNKASFEVSEEATLSEAVHTLELALKANGYVFDFLTVRDQKDAAGDFVVWDTQLDGDATYPTTYINNEKEEWRGQILVHHYSEEESKALASRICYLLNKYGYK